MTADKLVKPRKNAPPMQTRLGKRIAPWTARTRSTCEREISRSWPSQPRSRRSASTLVVSSLGSNSSTSDIAMCGVLSKLLLAPAISDVGHLEPATGEFLNHLELGVACKSGTMKVDSQRRRQRSGNLIGLIRQQADCELAMQAQLLDRGGGFRIGRRPEADDPCELPVRDDLQRHGNGSRRCQRA